MSITNMQPILPHLTPRIVARFQGKVGATDELGCYPWLGTQSKGYGTFGVRPTYNVRPHRLAYELVNGPIPAGLVLDHLCLNKLCVNPAHLEAVSAGENTRRRTRQVTCKRGHYDYGKPSPSGKRNCRTCGREAQVRGRRAKGIEPRVPSAPKAKVRQVRLLRTDRDICVRGHAPNWRWQGGRAGWACRECHRLSQWNRRHKPEPAR